MRQISRPLEDEQRSNSGRGLAGWARQWLAEQDPPILAWVVAIGLESVALILARGTSYQQLTIAILLTTVVLFVLLSLVEIVWRVLEEALGIPGKN